MKFSGTLDIAAPRERVWAFLTDPHQVTACAPDVQSVDVADAAHFRVVVRSGVGPVKATFAMNVEFAELVAPERATVRARGQAPGSAVDMTNTLELTVDRRRTPSRLLVSGSSGDTDIDLSIDVGPLFARAEETHELLERARRVRRREPDDQRTRAVVRSEDRYLPQRVSADRICALCEHECGDPIRATDPETASLAGLLPSRLASCARGRAPASFWVESAEMPRKKERRTRKPTPASAELAAIGARIRELRVAAGMSQTDLGRPFLSRAAISRIESGGGTSLKTLVHFARQLRRPMRDLFPRDL